MAEQISENKTGPEEKGEEQKDITQQATNPNPPPQENNRVKNPKRVAAGKATAEKTRQAREAQRKAAAEAADIIANNKAEKAKKREPPAISSARQEISPPEDEDHGRSSSTSGLCKTQWLMIGSIIVSLIGIYYKREELKSALSPHKNVQEPKSAENVAAPPIKQGLRNMDSIKNL